MFNIVLILLVGFFAMENLNVMLTKLRFVEIADDLNASFLEMRISEKNYFLYGDEAALFEIRDKINSTAESIEAVRNDISRAIGEDNLEKLRGYLKRYSIAVEEMAVDACLAGDPTAVFHAVAHDPLCAAVLSLAEIRALVNDMMEKNRPYLPTFVHFRA